MINKTFRLFVSSTFRDFNEERKILNDRIAQIVDDHCQKRGYNFQLIDLRWGVNNESALNQNTISICLDEVRRCKTLSPKPNFLILVGERYGWIPIPAHISADLFERLVSKASEEEKRLLNEWYVLDENEIGSEYFLKPRKDEFKDDLVWESTEEQLRDALLKCSEEANVPDHFTEALNSSATEMEIVEGLLGEEKRADSTIAFFRTGHTDVDEDVSKINALKERISGRLTADGYEDHLIQLDYAGLDYSNEFYENILQVLINNIDTEITRIENEKRKNEIDKLAMLKEEHGMFVFRDEEVAGLLEYIKGEARVPMFVTGGSGSGKTSLLLQVVQRSESTSFSVFFGADENSYTIVDSLHRLCREIHAFYHTGVSFSLNRNNVSECVFHTFYSIPASEKTVVVIDGLDMYYDIRTINERIFPSVLPSNVKLIISCADDEITQKFISSNDMMMSLDKFDFSAGKGLFRSYLSLENRCLSNARQNDVLDDVIRDGATPLQIKLLTGICSKWHSSDHIKALPKSVDEIVMMYFSNFYHKYGHDRELFLYTLALIAVSPYGITEDEIRKLLFQFPKVTNYFKNEDRYSHQMDILPFVVWSRLFYDLKGCLTLQLSHGSVVVKFVHNIYLRVFREKFGDYCSDALTVLTSYYYNSSTTVADRPNVRKALSLTPLLLGLEDYPKLIQLYTDLPFVDSVIKIGNANEVLHTIRILIAQSDDKKSADRLIGIGNCIAKNIESLECYCNNFCTFAYEEGLQSETKPVIYSENPFVKKEITYFPYSKSAGLKWHSNCDLYAVYTNAYVYICSLSANSEICRIYLEPIDLENKRSVHDVEWIGDTHLAVVTETRELLIYDISDRSPNVVSTYQCTSFCVCVDEKHNTLLYASHGVIKGIDPVTGKQKYQIDIQNKEDYRFSLSQDCQEILIRPKPRKISIYDSVDGVYKDCIMIPKLPWDEAFDSLNYNGSDVNKITEDRWLCYHSMHFSWMIVDRKAKRASHLLLPAWWKIRQSHRSDTKVAVQYDTMLLLIDLLDYSMAFYPLRDQCHISWVKPDKQIAILYQHGIEFLSVDEFEKFPQDKTCALTRSNDHYSGLNAFRLFFRAASVLSPLFSCLISSNNLEYTQMSMGCSELTLADFSFMEKDPNYATLYVKANDGSYFVGYEEDDACAVYDACGAPILHIDRLKLSLDNGIQSVMFSDDSKLLLLWRNLSVQVIELRTGKLLSDIRVASKPVYGVKFAEDSKHIQITFIDGTFCVVGVYDSKRRQKEDLPKEINKKRDYLNVGPYSTCIYQEKPYVNRLLTQNWSDIIWEYRSDRWLKNNRIYDAGSVFLWYNDGEFYLNGEETQRFDHPGIDFAKSHQLEQMHDPSYLRAFLREKNDVMSQLIVCDENHLILVSRMLGSIIVFDTKKMAVSAAYKHRGDIVGCTVLSRTELEIISCTIPYKTRYRLFIED